MRKTVIVVAILMACTGWRGSGDAPRHAKAYGERHFGKTFKSVECVSGARADSDGDGYVSCTLFFSDARPPLGIECSTGIGCGTQEGCRLATGKSNRR